MNPNIPWEGNIPPAKIFGNLYFVGTIPASTHIIDTGDGLIMLDSGYQHSLYLVLHNMYKLGLNPADLKYIVHTHAKDGKQIFFRDPEIVYGIKKDVIVTDDSFIEVPLGEGSVPFPQYLNALEEIGYNGFLTIEREVGDNPEKDIRAAVDFLKNTMK